VMGKLLNTSADSLHVGRKGLWKVNRYLSIVAIPCKQH
jgi:hypothetical protein